MTSVQRLKAALRLLPSASAVDIHERVELGAWTSLRVGGPADIMIRCNTVAAVRDVTGLLESLGERPFILGAGTNVVLPDEGLRVPVITLGGELARWELDLDGVVAGGGANLTRVCRAVARAGMSGMEPLFGVPGSVGGAVVMNAGAYGVEIFDLVEWVQVVRPGEEAVMLRADEVEHGYRTTGLGRGGEIVVRVRLGLQPDDLAAIHGRLREVNEKRRRKLPAGTSAGSIFKNPPEGYAGALLEAAGCKGWRVGGARVSERHANVIVTSRGATAADVLELTRRMRMAVRERLDVELEPEIRFIDQQGGRIAP